MKKRILKIFIIIFLSLNLIIQILLVVNNSGINILDLYQQPIVTKDKIPVDYQNKYIIKNKSYFESQGLNQCAGYSLAYNLRHINIKTSGKQTYNKLDFKLSNGYVLPKAIIKEFKNNNFNAKVYQGTIEQLKSRLNNNKPLIVLIGDSFKWQHYVTVVGYDKENIYLYDSLVTNVSNKNYNRKLTTTEFIKLWQNALPIYSSIYFVYENK